MGTRKRSLLLQGRGMMAKVTSKFQVALPKVITDQYGIHPGDEIDWKPARDVIRVIPSSRRQQPQDRDSRVRLFDQATDRHRRRPSPEAPRSRERRWRREDLYARGRSH